MELTVAKIGTTATSNGNIIVTFHALQMQEGIFGVPTEVRKTFMYAARPNEVANVAVGEVINANMDNYAIEDHTSDMPDGTKLTLTWMHKRINATARPVARPVVEPATTQAPPVEPQGATQPQMTPEQVAQFMAQQNATQAQTQGVF